MILRQKNVTSCSIKTESIPYLSLSTLWHSVEY